jgi:glycyl-tRNA synthetase beta chain
MGYYYAKALGEDELVYRAIKEQYMPTGDNSNLPSNLFSTLVSMAIILDTIYGLFSVGKIPTGSKEPFALRRAVNGIARMVIANDLPFNLDAIFEKLKPLYKDFDINILKEFIFERIYKLTSVNPSVVSAVLSSNDSDLNSIFKKIEALNSIVEQENSKELFTTFKRVANISKDIDLNSNLEIDTSLFEKEEEKNLYNEFIKVKNSKYDDYLDKLNALFGLKNSLDKFFDNVLVNAEDKMLKKNRQNLIASIYKEFKDIADIKEVTI